MKYLTGNTILIILTFQYLAIALLYAVEGNWAKVTYFIGAFILSIGVLCMK